MKSVIQRKCIAAIPDKGWECYFYEVMFCFEIPQTLTLQFYAHLGIGEKTATANYGTCF